MSKSKLITPKTNSVLFFILSSAVIVAAGGCSSYDDGYRHGQSDAIKEQYWMAQEMQRSKKKSGGIDYEIYTVDGVRKDGRGINYSDHKIDVMIKE